jgi:carbon storage regulator
MQSMLILTRRVQETVVIGAGPRAIRLTVLGIKGRQVRVGIDAPRDIEVHREEIYDRLKQRGRNA